MHILKHVGRLLVLTALLAAGFGQQAPARAEAPAAVAVEPSGPGISAAPPPGCIPTTHVYDHNVSQLINDLSTITSTLTVSGLAQRIWDVQVHTGISHTYDSDLNVYLIQPDSFGQRIALTTRNGYDGDGHDVDNALSNTVWSDQAPLGVTEITDFAPSPHSLFLIPEGALGATYNKVANGDWKLVVQDTVAQDTGTLNNWSLDITTLDSPLVGKSVFPQNLAVQNIPDPGTITSTILVSGLGPVLENLTAMTFITHTASGDLRIILTSPTGLTTTLTNGRGGSAADQFNGTTWTDDPINEPGPVTDQTYLSGQPLQQVQPEGAMRHFAGSNPNGPWTLTVADLNGNGKTGALNGWQLGVYTGYCAKAYLPEVVH